MPEGDNDFDDIVAPLREERFTTRPPRRRLFIAGIACCVAAVALFIFGGVEGAVLAVIPWIAGMLLVVAGRSNQ
ncbi:hypothetical protein AB0M54_26105 [Actinoplanes sp. NPDC051470]|uniref:hypothetical protein n=1 Tax=unclassified Actinoplanes TaxID=2626549 RepID=UPI0034403E8B